MPLIPRHLDGKTDKTTPESWRAKGEMGGGRGGDADEGFGKDEDDDEDEDEGGIRR